MPSGKKTTTKQKIAIGTHRKDRHAGLMDLAVPTINYFPEFEKVFTITGKMNELEESSKILYETICKMLLKTGMLQEIGIHLIKKYVNAHRIYTEAEKDAMDQPTLDQESRYGIIRKQNPAVATMATAFNIMNNLEGKFGFTPLTQSRIRGAGNEKPDTNEKDPLGIGK